MDVEVGLERAECRKIDAFELVLEKTLESPLGFKESQGIVYLVYLVYSLSSLSSLIVYLVYPKGIQSWIFIGRTDAEAETPILWLPDGKNSLIWKNPDAGKDWRQAEKVMTKDEIVGWHDLMDLSLRKRWEVVIDSEAWHAAVHGVAESDKTEWLKWTEQSLWWVWRFLKNLKIELTYDSSIPLLEIYLEKTILKRYMHLYVHYNTICNSQDIEAT